MSKSNHASVSNGADTFPRWDAQAKFAEFAGMGRENFDALVRASTIAVTGYGSIAQQWAEFTKTTVEHGVETARAVFSTKNVKDALEIQSGFARSTFDRYMSEANKLSELSARTTSDAMAPLKQRVDEVVAKFGHTS